MLYNGLRQLLVCQLLNSASILLPQPAVGMLMQPVSTCPHCEMGTSHCIKVTAACSWRLAQIAPALLSPDIQCCSVEHCASENELVLLLPFIYQITSNFPACSCCTRAMCKPCQTCWSATAA